MTIAVADPADFRTRLERCLGVAPDEAGGFKLAAGRVGVVDGAWVAEHVPAGAPPLPFIAGSASASPTSVRTADLLATSGVPFEPRGSSVWVAHVGGLRGVRRSSSAAAIAEMARENQTRRWMRPKL